MSKYLIYYGSKLPKYANDEQYGAWYDILNPKTAWNYYAKKGVTSLPGDFIDEARDYKEVRDTISNRPKVLRKAARKLRDIPFDPSQPKKLFNYRGSGWSNIISQTPTSPAEAYAIVGAMYYMTGNIYNTPELLTMGDGFVNQSKSASADKNVKESLKILNKGVKKLNNDAKKTGAIPAWYNIFGQIDQMIKGDTAFDSINKYAKVLNSKSEIEFAEKMREARMEDESPLGSLVGVFASNVAFII